MADEGRIRLRAVTAGDRPFLMALFASTRGPELAALPDDALRDAFIASQFDLQDHHYRAHYPGATFDVIECDGERAGRIYVHRREDEIRLMEITVAPEWRQRGIARRLLAALIAESDSTGRPIGLHVEPDNPANAWYRRLGFRHQLDNGAYQFLLRPPRTPDEAAAAPAAASLS